MDSFSLEALWEQHRAQILLFLGRLTSSLIILGIFWLAGKAVQRVIHRLCQARAVKQDLVYFLAGSAKGALLAIGLVTALGTMGVDVTALVASLGLVGFALGFALKDMISNALAGVLILLYKPFARGDRITIDSNQGTIAEINLHYTVLSNEDTRILIPNASLFTTIVKVSTASPAQFQQGTGPGARPFP
jgi:small-conductance mechanosensitive channel